MKISLLNYLMNKFGYEIKEINVSFPFNIKGIPDEELYSPLFSPWLGKGEFQNYYNLAIERTVVSKERCYVIFSLLQQSIHIDGDIWECGVYKGGTAAMIAALVKNKATSKRLYLFDTFEGMPDTDSLKDWHKKGDFSDTTIDSVKKYIGHEELCVFRKGLIPETFDGLENAKIAFAHIDVDIYKSILDCLNFIWPRLSLGGIIVFDDYGFPTCPGARAAVDEFFYYKKCIPLCLSTGQSLVFKGIGNN